MYQETTVIDLKQHQEFLEQYITLRNRYVGVLLTSPVTLAETQKWFANSHVEIWGIVEEQVLLGVALLYLDKGGEVAFFVREPNKGTGSQLLCIIKQIASDKRLPSIWAWVLHDNMSAQKAFEKNGFVRMGMSRREYQGVLKEGFEYRLPL